MAIGRQVGHEPDGSSSARSANFDFNVMDVVRAHLTRDDARYGLLPPAEHVEADQLPNFTGEDAFVSARVDQRKIANRLPGSRIPNDDGYDRPLDAVRKSLIGELHNRRRYRGCRVRGTGSAQARLSRRSPRAHPSRSALPPERSPRRQREQPTARDTSRTAATSL